MQWEGSSEANGGGYGGKVEVWGIDLAGAERGLTMVLVILRSAQAGAALRFWVACWAACRDGKVPWPLADAPSSRLGARRGLQSGCPVPAKRQPNASQRAAAIAA